MEILHTSPEKIERINKNGVFDDILFFSDDEYVMTACTNYYLYKLNVDRSNLIETCMLDDESTFNEVSEALNIDVETAIDLICERKTTYELGLDSDDSIYIQTMIGLCAKRMGFIGAIATDEQGTVYIVPMSDNLHLLKLVK